MTGEIILFRKKSQELILSHFSVRKKTKTILLITCASIVLDGRKMIDEMKTSSRLIRMMRISVNYCLIWLMRSTWNQKNYFLTAVGCVIFSMFNGIVFPQITSSTKKKKKNSNAHTHGKSYVLRSNILRSNFFSTDLNEQIVFVNSSPIILWLWLMFCFDHRLRMLLDFVSLSLLSFSLSLSLAIECFWQFIFIQHHYVSIDDDRFL